MALSFVNVYLFSVTDQWKCRSASAWRLLPQTLVTVKIVSQRTAAPKRVSPKTHMSIGKTLSSFQKHKIYEIKRYIRAGIFGNFWVYKLISCFFWENILILLVFSMRPQVEVSHIISKSYWREGVKLLKFCHVGCPPRRGAFVNLTQTYSKLTQDWLKFDRWFIGDFPMFAADLRGWLAGKNKCRRAGKKKCKLVFVELFSAFCQKRPWQISDRIVSYLVDYVRIFPGNFLT